MTPVNSLADCILATARLYLSVYADWSLEQAMNIAISEWDAWSLVDSGNPSLSSLYSTLFQEYPARV